MPKPERPATPNLDLARQEAEALAKYEQEVQEYERRQREEAPARAKAAAERLAHRKQCKAKCQEAAVRAEKLAVQLSSALADFVNSSDRPRFDVLGRVQEFLAPYVRQYGDLTGRSSSGSYQVLMRDLFPEVSDA